ncbi:MAG: SAM-dependent methyltransferase containing domain [Verrucomicrobiales bacterium]|nr:SAM-dependent methyltransferase containing domain [Verrucomicrobiales bacterium]
MKKPSNTLRVHVTPTADWKLRSGHPWLYSDSIQKQSRSAEAGELAVVYDRHDNFLAIGLFDPASPLRVRVLHRGKPTVITEDWWLAHFREPIQRRAGLFGADTTGYRYINGESDGWPGFVLDRYGSTLVLKLYSAIWFRRLAEIQQQIQAELNPERLVLRLSRNTQDVARAGFKLSDGQILLGPPIKAAVEFLENDLTFEADVLRGQKTGFFLDQRENRAAVGALAKGRDVLNCFSFSGGFSLYAARSGAKSVTDLDISAHALESSRRNFGLNQRIREVAQCRHDLIQADTFKWMLQNPESRFDLVVLDPPSLAKRENERDGAIQAYGNLAAQGIHRLRPGGILVASSCSAHVSAPEFWEMVRTAARNSRRLFAELQTTTHPADHPATFPEAHYLKTIFLRFEP